MPAKKKITIEKQTPQAQHHNVNILSRLRKLDLRGIMFIAIILMAFVIGRLTQKVEDLQQGVSNPANVTAQGTQTPPPQTVSLDTIKGLWDKDIIKFGDANKKVLFVEVGDPSCPFCHAAAGENHTIYQSLGGSNFKLVEDGGTYIAPVTEMKKLVSSGQASFTYIYFPGHGNGEMGMKALYCANEKGKFWQVHDLLMSDNGYNELNNVVKNDKTQSGTLATYLRAAVDPTFLKSCLDSGKYDSQLGTDQALASTLNISGTPGFFVNSTSYPGAYSWNDMKSVVDAALK